MCQKSGITQVIPLNIMKLDWIFIKIILKLSKCNRIFIKFIIKLWNCYKLFSYVTSFRVFRNKYQKIRHFVTENKVIVFSIYWKVTKLSNCFFNLLKSNWIFWHSILILRNSHWIKLQSRVSGNCGRNF